MVTLQDFAAQHHGYTQGREVTGAYHIHCRIAITVSPWRVAFHPDACRGFAPTEYTQLRKAHPAHSRNSLDLSDDFSTQALVPRRLGRFVQIDAHEQQGFYRKAEIRAL